MPIALPQNRLGELASRDGKRLAVIAAHCDVDQSTVYRWREGQTAIPDEQKLRLADFFNVTVAYLMGWAEQVPTAVSASDDSGRKAAA